MDSEDEGPCAKAGNSMVMLCVGIVCLPMALLFLAWNENSFVCENNRLLIADQEAQELSCESPLTASAQQARDGLAFFSCPLLEESLQVFTPCAFNEGKMDCATQPPVSFRAVSGRQMVKMYQCQESCSDTTSKNLLGQNVKARSCSYKGGWFEWKIDSRLFSGLPTQVALGCPGFEFALANPDFPQNLAPGSTTDYAHAVEAGKGRSFKSYALNDELIAKLQPDTPVSLAPFAANFSGAKVPALGRRPWVRPMVVSKDALIVSGDDLETCAPPYQIGCVRISYLHSPVASVSVITHVAELGTTSPQQIRGGWGCKAAKWQEILPGTMSKAEMIAGLQENNKYATWLLRALGACLCWAAVYCCLQPLSAAADLLGDVANMCPCGGYLEDMIEGVVTTALCFMSCGLGCSCALFVIALVWLYMRPLYGMLLAGLGVCSCCAALGARQAFGPPNRKYAEDEESSE